MDMTEFDLGGLKQKIQQLPEFELQQFYFKQASKYKLADRFVAVRNKNSGEIVACVSPKYKLVQFKTIFESVVNKFSNKIISGSANVYSSTGHLFLRLRGNADISADYGLSVFNSVDSSSSLFINALVLYRQSKIVVPVPKKVTKMHVGNIEEFAENILVELKKLENYCQVMFVEFNKIKVTTEEATEIINQINSSRRYSKKVFSYFNLTGSDSLRTLFVACCRALSVLSFEKTETKRFMYLNHIAKVFEKRAIMLKI